MTRENTSMATPLNLVLGATGTIGREVVKQLVDAGHRVRAAVRDPGKAATIGRGVEIVQADLAKPDTLAAACAGADNAFVLSNGPGIALEPNAYSAAKAAGIRHVVRISAQEIEFPELAATPLGQWHLEADRRLHQAGVAWTLLRPSFFSSNMFFPFILDRREGAAFLPTGDGREAPIDPRDIAAAAVMTLTTPGHEGEVYVLTGPKLLSFAEMMEKLSFAIGRPFEHVDLTSTEAHKRLMAAGIPPVVAESLLGHFAAIKAGRAYVTSTLARLLGRPPRSFDDWVRDNTAPLSA
jgi:uncharacterized protein YbjT (DUF2867 family)